MKIFNRVKGISGESQAVKYLKKKKYKILQQNYKNAIGEIDIIAKLKETIIFVEVKSRLSLEFGRPAEAVDARKQNKIRLVAAAYLKQNKLLDQPCRFDVIEVLPDEINHIENAF